jgi:hypothetical protein
MDVKISSCKRYLFHASKIIFLSIVLLVSYASTMVHAQVFGGNPSSIKWKQINTDTARVIFPEGLESSARRVASIIHDIHSNHSSPLGNKVRKVNIVLQNLSTVSNAYVGLGPYRSEFYLMAPQNSFELGGQSWLDNLSLHEYRHVLQYSNFNVGLAKGLTILFGQQGQAVANSAAVPDYFFEGDAVFNETSLSRQGRGRIPYFFNGYESLLRDQKHYSFMKLRNGSYKDFVPDHYAIGYLLVGYGREKYGADFWRKVSQDAVRFQPLFYPWQGAIKKYAGINYKQFVNDAFNFYNEKWKQAKGVNIQYITPTTKAPTDYKYPYKDVDGSLIVLKRGYKKIPTFYRLTPSGKEDKIAVRDIAYEDYFSFNNGRIVYATLNPAHRWGYREYSDIVMMDAATGHRKKVTRHERFFSPDISHDGRKFVAVDMRINQTSNIVIVDSAGNSLFRSAAVRGVVYTYPKFSADDKQIFSLVRNEDNNMALVKIDVSTGKETQLISYANRVYAYPTIQGDTIIFSSSYKGSDEVWAYVDGTKETYRVAVHPTGLYQAVLDQQGGKLYTSNFTSSGFKLASVSSGELLWQRISEKENALPDLYVPNALQQENAATLESVANRSFDISKYHKGVRLFNFHSWRPYYSEPEISYTLYGENILNTFHSELSYTFNRNESSHRVGYSAIYGGWYIQPLAGVNYTWNRTVTDSRGTQYHYNEIVGNVGAQLPLNLSGGRQIRSLVLSTTLNTEQVRWSGFSKEFFLNQTFNYIQGRIAYAGQIQKAVQHIYPRWGQTLALQYKAIINKYTANQFLATGAIYLPGLLVNHNTVITAAYHQRDTLNQYLFSNSFPFSRGYTAIDFPRMWRLGFNYHFPLFYPDLGLANIVYFKRIRANGFYDLTQGKSLRTGSIFNFNTAGGEVFFDTRWWNQQPVTIGVRYSRLLDNEFRGTTVPNQWEIILPINLFDL